MYMIRRCAALLETLRGRAPLMERHFLLRHSRVPGERHGNDLANVGSALRQHEERVCRMMVADGAVEGPAIRGKSQDAVAALVVFNSKMALTFLCLNQKMNLYLSGLKMIPLKLLTVIAYVSFL